MNPKTTIVLVMALMLAVIGVWWVQSSEQQQEPADAGPKPLFDPAPGDITAFEIKTGDDPALVLSKQGDQWTLEKPVQGPAEHFAVNSDVTKVAGLTIAKSYKPGDDDRPSDSMAGLSPPRRVVKLTESGGDSHVLKIGERQALSDRTYVQKQGDETIYLVEADLNKELKGGLTDYRGKQIARFNPADAVRVELSGAHDYVLVKSNDRWTVDAPVKGRADSAIVNNLLRSLSNLRVVEFVTDDPPSLRPYGLEEPQFAVTVKTEKKTPVPPPPPPATAPAEPEFEVKTEQIRVAFGGRAGDKVFARQLETPVRSVIQVNEATVKQIEKGLDDVRSKNLIGTETARAQKLVVEAEGDAVTLEKKESVWQITEFPNDDPMKFAEFAAVDELLRTLKDLKAIGFEDKVLPTFGFDEPRAVIELHTEGQIEPDRLIVGNATPSQTGVYVRNAREDLVAVVPAPTAEKLTIKPHAFLNRQVVRFRRETAERIEINRGDETIALAKAGAGWRFKAPVEGPTNTTAVNNILADLSNLRGRRVVARPASASAFGLNNPTVTVQVTVRPLAEPTTQPAEPPPPKSYTLRFSEHDGLVYAMAEQGSVICEIDAKVLDDLRAEFLDTKIFTLKPADITRISAAGAVPYAFQKRGENWTLDGEATFQTDADKITELLNALRDLRAESYVAYKDADPAAYGLTKPHATLTASAADGTTHELMISADGPDAGGRYATTGATPGRVFVIQSDDVTGLARGVADFQKGV